MTRAPRALALVAAGFCLLSACGEERKRPVRTPVTPSARDDEYLAWHRKTNERPDGVLEARIGQSRKEVEGVCSRPTADAKGRTVCVTDRERGADVAGRAVVTDFDHERACVVSEEIARPAGMDDVRWWHIYEDAVHAAEDKWGIPDLIEADLPVDCGVPAQCVHAGKGEVVFAWRWFTKPRAALFVTLQKRDDGREVVATTTYDAVGVEREAPVAARPVGGG